MEAYHEAAAQWSAKPALERSDQSCGLGFAQPRLECNTLPREER